MSQSSRWDFDAIGDASDGHGDDASVALDGLPSGLVLWSIVVGSDNLTPVYPVDGTIDEVEVFDRALAADEIAAL